MKRKLLRYGALGASAAVVAGGLVLGAGAASAATVIGTLSVSPASGNTTTNFNVITSAGCPADDDGVGATIAPHTGATAANTLQLVGSQLLSTVGGSHTHGFSVPISDNLFNLAQGQGVTLNAGQYDIQFTCLTGGGFQDPAASDGEFDGSIFLAAVSNGVQNYQSTDPASAASTTTLAAVPANTSVQGSSVALTASVTSPAPGTNTGTVTFKDGSNTLGTGTLSGGHASFSTSALTPGSHTLTAVYGGDTETLGSTSAGLPYSVTVPQNPTTTSLSAPASIGQFSPATFTIAVTPNTLSGSVTLTENGSTIGTGTVTNGAGTATATFSTQGAHSVVANFTPTDTTFAPSSSAAVPVTVGPSTGVSVPETIETTISAGSLTISVANNAKVILPTPTLDPNAGVLVTTGAINPVTVTDTRAGAPGFTVSGIVTDFSDGATPTAHLINGFDLGWTPFIIDAPGGMHITAGAQVNPALGVAPGVTPSDTTVGLKSLRTLATNPAGGLGTTHLGANLQLDAPTSTTAGTYDATLTLTAI